MYFFGNTYFQSFVFKNVFQFLISAVLLTDLGLFVFTKVNNRKAPGMKTKKDKGSMPLIIIGFLLVLCFNPFCVKTFQIVLPDWTFWIGSLLMTAGILLRIYSVWTLRKYFTFTVQVGEEQKLIENGPYHYLRHPAYSGSILALMGISLCFRSPIGVLITALIIAVIYGYRIKIEEAALEQNFGSSYQKYKDRTYKVIPFIW